MSNKIKKISIYCNNKLVIENYDSIIDINNQEIIIDYYKIIGETLKIKSIDEYYIIIEGNINGVYINSDLN